MKTQKQKGFTLLELMIVVAIVAILASIALPSYQESMRKGRRADGMNKIMELAALQERFYSDNGGYGTLAAIAGGANINSDEGFYVVTAVLGGGGRPQTFILTATRQGAQVDDARCGDFTYTQAGVKGLLNQGAGVTPDQCW